MEKTYHFDFKSGIYTLYKLTVPRFTSYLNYLDIFVLRKSRQQLTSLQTRRTICIMSSYSRGWRDMQTCIRNYHNTSFYNLHNFYWVQFPLVGDCLRTFSWLKKSMFDILNLFHRSNISINLSCVIHLLTTFARDYKMLILVWNLPPNRQQRYPEYSNDPVANSA